VTILLEAPCGDEGEPVVDVVVVPIRCPILLEQKLQATASRVSTIAVGGTPDLSGAEQF